MKKNKLNEFKKLICSFMAAGMILSSGCGQTNENKVDSTKPGNVATQNNDIPNTNLFEQPETEKILSEPSYEYKTVLLIMNEEESKAFILDKKIDNLDAYQYYLYSDDSGLFMCEFVDFCLDEFDFLDKDAKYTCVYFISRMDDVNVVIQAQRIAKVSCGENVEIGYIDDIKQTPVMKKG